MQSKWTIIKANTPSSRQASKKRKSEILDELVKTTHLPGKYLITLLNATRRVVYLKRNTRLVGGPTATPLHRREGKRSYTPEIIFLLELGS